MFIRALLRPHLLYSAAVNINENILLQRNCVLIFLQLELAFHRINVKQKTVEISERKITKRQNIIEFESEIQIKSNDCHYEIIKEHVTQRHSILHAVDGKFICLMRQ